MGGHYGSVQIRSENRDEVRAAALQVAREQGIRLLLSPATNGWISLFPENHGQDQQVAERLSKAIGSPVLHLMVHDDDVFAYWLYQRGHELDSYWNMPGYFGEENRAAEERMTGNAQA